MGGGGSRNLSRVGEQDSVVKQQIVNYRAIWPGYFEMLEVPLRAGRKFTASDIEGSAPVVIVNEALAREYFPGKNAIGERIILSPPARPGGGWDARTPDKTPPPPREIVGIVADVKQQPVEILPQASVAYVPFRQDPPTLLVFAARTSGPPSQMTMAVVDQIRPRAPDMQIFNISNMENADSQFDPRYPVHPDAPNGFRCARADPGSGWYLWNQFLFNLAAHARVRHSDGLGRAGPRCIANGVEAGTQVDDDWIRAGRWGSVRAGEDRD